MKFLHLNDINGRQHLVNPIHIAAIQEVDVGCVLHLRGRGITPIVLNETVEVMRDALQALDESETESPQSRWRR